MRPILTLSMMFLDWPHKGTYKNGKADGAYESYYENGQLERKANYKDGKLNGDWKYYNEDGTIRD